MHWLTPFPEGPPGATASLEVVMLMVQRYQRMRPWQQANSTAHTAGGLTTEVFLELQHRKRGLRQGKTDDVIRMNNKTHSKLVPNFMQVRFEFHLDVSDSSL